MFPAGLLPRTITACAFAFGLGIVGATCGSHPSKAITLTIDGSGTPYTESGFQIIPIQIVSGNCDGASGSPCLALGPGDTSELSKVGGGTFSLTSFGFEFQGQPSVLTVTEKDGATVVNTLTFDQTVCDKNIWCVITLNSPFITAIDFSDTGDGNIRIDDLVISLRSDAPPPGTPIPGALPLFASGAGVLGYLGWRRKRKAKAA